MEKNRLSDGNPSGKIPRNASFGPSFLADPRVDNVTGTHDNAEGTIGSTRHICVVTETYPPEVNGVALTLSHLVRGLLARGHAISIVRPRQRRSDREKSSPEVTLVSGLPLPGYKGLQFGLPCGGLLEQLWTRRRPDVVYVATEGPLGWSAVRIACRLAIPVLSGFHTNFHSYSRHYRVGFLQNLVFRYLRGFHNLTNATLVPSLDLRDRLLALGFRNVDYVGRGVDSEFFDPKKRSVELRRSWGIEDDDLVLLYVGRVAGEKNLQLAIDAYRAAKRADDSLKFVIVGDGPLRRSLQTGNSDLIFCGMQTGESLAAHYASGDVFLFPSETETFGNVTMEAMASGLGVVAYDYAAAKWHITDGETGVLVPFGDYRAFIDATVRLVRERGALQEMRRRAREYAASITWARVVERFEMLLIGREEDRQVAMNSAIARRRLAAAARGRI